MEAANCSKDMSTVVFVKSLLLPRNSPPVYIALLLKHSRLVPGVETAMVLLLSMHGSPSTQTEALLCARSWLSFFKQTWRVLDGI